MGSSFNAGGEGTIQLPQWTFDSSLSGSPTSGFFQTNNGNFASATQLFFNNIPKNATFDCSSLFTSGAVSGLIILIDTNGKSTILKWNPLPTTSGGITTLNISILASDNIQLSGVYSISFTALTSELSIILGISSITPITDGTYTIVGPNSNGSISFIQGICVAFSPNS